MTPVKPKINFLNKPYSICCGNCISEPLESSWDNGLEVFELKETLFGKKKLGRP